MDTCIFCFTTTCPIQYSQNLFIFPQFIPSFHPTTHQALQSLPFLHHICTSHHKMIDILHLSISTFLIYKFDSDVTSCVTMCVVVLKGGKERCPRSRFHTKQQDIFLGRIAQHAVEQEPNKSRKVLLQIQSLSCPNAPSRNLASK